MAVWKLRVNQSREVVNWIDDIFQFVSQKSYLLF
jgi:hypothetical protein